MSQSSIRFIFILMFMILSGYASSVNEKDYSRLFGKHAGTIVIYDQHSKQYIVHNKERSNIRFTPFSTFKIPNSIIALETGIISDVDKIYQWDTVKYPSEDWWPPQWKGKHNMRSAFKYSVVPFYRNIASQVGSKTMKEYLDKFNYGNKDNSSGVDNFWLNGSLSISAVEQIEFLTKFYNCKLGVSNKSTRAVKDILILEKSEKFTLSGKTGGGIIDNDSKKVLGWFVGYVEKGEKVYFFALNIDGNGFSDIQNSRIDITKSVLKDLNILE